MNTELAWLSLPIGSMFWALGGTFKKQIRRIGIPALLMAVILLFHGLSWVMFVVGALAFAVTTLPITLKGNSLHDHWFNWVWVFILGLLFGLVATPLAIITNQWGVWLPSLILTTIGVGAPICLSNIPLTARFFQWKMVECWLGAMIMIGSVLLITY